MNDGATAAPARPGRLTGRTALITGSTGIAEATAERFAAEGARVFVVSRTEGHCRELVDGLVASGTEAAWAVADLEDETQAEAAVAAAAERFGRIDALFNVAGGSGRRFGDAPVHELTMEAWERTLSLNARTHVTASRAVLARMLAQDPDAHGARGAILNMTSILAYVPVPDLFPTHAYAASKGAIATLTRTMAAYYVRHGIRVNAVAPSLTTSRMSARAASDAATLELAARRQPLTGGFLAADDVADAALFLLSPESRAITGQVLLVDGGWSVTPASERVMELTVRAPLLATADVVVAGSGSAGSTAAIAAARAGASVLLIEKLPFLGGTSTAVLDTFYGFFTPGSRSIKVVGGIADEVVGGLRALGPVLERPNTYGAGTGVTYHPEHLKAVWERLVAEAGARILLHAAVQGATVVDGRVTELLLATKAGLARVAGSVFVDATGDADVCFHAGFGYELAGDLEPAQTLTTTFRVVNVDQSRRGTVTRDELHGLMADAAESGGYDLPRREGSDHITPVAGMTATIMTRIESVRREDDRVVNATDPLLLSEAEMAGRRQALEYIRFLVDRVPGYERASLASFSTQIGVRETRRVYGDARLTREDVLVARRFPDEVGLCGAPIEDHHAGADTHWQYLPDGEVVGIPYQTLLVRDAANVLVAGRCFSATHDAHASVRSMAQCMAMGQAAGTAAGLAARARVTPRDIPADRLRAHLGADGAVLDIAQPTAA